MRSGFVCLRLPRSLRLIDQVDDLGGLPVSDVTREDTAIRRDEEQGWHDLDVEGLHIRVLDLERRKNAIGQGGFHLIV